MMKTLMAMAAAVGATTAMFGVGVAHAEQDITGWKYSDAQASLKSQGLTAQVSARVGDRLQQADCLVTSFTKSAKPDGGFHGKGQIVLIALDCNGIVASATNPGYSAASPEGRAAAKKQQNEEWMKTPEGQQWCATATKEHPDWKLKCG
jgi:hypothetical protein